MEELIGKTIVSIYMDPDSFVLGFLDSTGKLHLYETQSDCCSATWFNHIYNPENMIGTPVLAIEDRDFPIKEKKPRRGMYIKYYGISIRTIKGYTDIDYRNESNGYYGGDCVYAGFTKLPSYGDDLSFDLKDEEVSLKKLENLNG